MGLFFVPPTFALFVVREKEFKQKHQQYVSGLSPMVYWLSNFTYDIVALLMVLVMVVILLAAFSVSSGMG